MKLWEYSVCVYDVLQEMGSMTVYRSADIYLSLPKLQTLCFQGHSLPLELC